MSLWRAIGSLLARRFSPRAATPGTAPARSLHSSLRDLSIGDVLDGALIFAAATLGSAGGTLALRHYTKGPAGEMIGDREEVITHIRKPDMKERFEQFIMKNDKTYRDEEEKAMRFQLFKATVEWIESQPPDVQKRMFPEITYFADFTEQEQQSLLAFPDEESMNAIHERLKALLAIHEKGESVVYMRDDKEGDKEGNKQRDKEGDKQRDKEGNKEGDKECDKEGDKQRKKQRGKQATQAAA